MIDNEFTKLLSTHKNDAILFVGIGSELRGDEAAIKTLVEKIQNLQKEKIYAIWTETRPENFLSEILETKTKHVIFIQANKFGGNPGDTKIIPIKEHDIKSLHESPLTSLAHYLNHELNATSSILMIEPKNSIIGNISDEINTTVDLVIESIQKNPI